MSDEITTEVGGATVKIDTSDANDAGPAAQMIRMGMAPMDVTDATGRVITLKRPMGLDNLKFAKAAGGAGLNELYLAECAHLKYVKAIDGVAVVCPGTEAELDALYVRLGDEGNVAAQLGVYEHFMAKPSDEKEELKNS